MKAWRRATLTCLCGHCSEIIMPGQPVFLIRPQDSMYALRHPKRRCQQCAGDRPPEELEDEGPPRLVLTFAPDVEPMTQIAMVGKTLTFDRSARLVGSE